MNRRCSRAHPRRPLLIPALAAVMALAACAGEETKKVTKDTAPPKLGLASEPAGLFVEGGVAQVQKALSERGLVEGEMKSGTVDKVTSAAIRRFQEQQGLAQTGVPDLGTVRRLGLDVESVFKANYVSPASKEKRATVVEEGDVRKPDAS